MVKYGLKGNQGQQQCVCVCVHLSGDADAPTLHQRPGNQCSNGYFTVQQAACLYQTQTEAFLLGSKSAAARAEERN